MSPLREVYTTGMALPKGRANLKKLISHVLCNAALAALGEALTMTEELPAACGPDVSRTREKLPPCCAIGVRQVFERTEGRKSRGFQDLAVYHIMRHRERNISAAEQRGWLGTTSRQITAAEFLQSFTKNCTRDCVRGPDEPCTQCFAMESSSVLS